MSVQSIGNTPIVRTNLWVKRFCWTCGQDKPSLGGRVRGARIGKAPHGPQRFTCVDCLPKAVA